MKGRWADDSGASPRARYRLGALLLNLAAISASLFGGGSIITTGIVGLWGFSTTALGGFLFSTGLSIALNLAMRPNPPTPKLSDIQTNIRQAISPRRSLRGTMLTGSVIVFGFRRGDKSYILHYICEGPIKGYLSYRLDRKPVTLDANGFVTDDQYHIEGHSRVQILSTRGLMTDEPFQEILDAFPELDDPLKPFRHRGCAMVLQIVEQVDIEEFQDVYPNNLPSLQVVAEGLDDIFDPATETIAFTENAGLHLLDESMEVCGLTPADTDDIDMQAWADFAAHCDENAPLKAGGFEKRYRCCGVIQLNAENEDRIRAIASICNADVFLDARGRLSVRKKLGTAPGFALRARYGDHLAVEIEGGRTEQKKFNTAKIVYVDAAQNYKENEVTWRHHGLIEADGRELTEPFNAQLCPSPGQAQRLGKLFVHERNPEFVGIVSSGPQALELIASEVFTLDLTPEDNFERVACATGEIGFDPKQKTVSAGITIFAEDATAWDPETDEQEQVEAPPVLVSHVDDVTLDVVVTVELLENSAPILSFSWTAAGGATLHDSYSQHVQVSAAGASDWQNADVNQREDTARFGPVADGGAYDWRIRNRANGKTFDWQLSVTPVTVTVDSTPPQALIAFSASDGTGQFVANFGTSNDSHLAAVAVYKVPAGGMLDRGAHIVGPPFAVAPGISYALPITSSAGSYDIYAEPFNRSSIAGPLAGPDGAIVS